MSLQLENTRGEGFYMQIAQKLDMHLKSFDSDKNTQLRWIWELIQNAKDAPNDFKSVKIRQELNDDSFVSSHNGNAFTIPELHSLIAQYSTKTELNNQERKTTGKYGTGFITTFLVSRKVTIDGYFSIDKNYKEQKEEEQVMKQENKQDSYAQQQEDSENQRFYFNKFSINLDRTYNERDTQFKRKVRKADRDLTDIVEKAEDQHKELRRIPLGQLIKNKKKFEPHFSYLQKRNVNSLNTSFTYPLVDRQKILIIQSAILNAFQLMPYAILFNENFTSYEFINNNSSLHKSNSFSFERIQLNRFSHKKNSKKIHKFSYLFKSQYDYSLKRFMKEETKYMAAFLDENYKVLAAIPLTYSEDLWKVERVSNCQVFKDFPLIGSQKTGWNGVINSDNFYPNQKRSDLLLSSTDKFSQSKVKQNKKEILKCFQGIKELYIFLATQLCDQGLQNLLILDNENSFTKEVQMLKNNLESYMSEILGIKFIPTGQNDKTKSSPKQLIFISAECFFTHPDLKKRDKLSLIKEMGKKISQVFRFLYEDEHILSQEKYQSYYGILKNQVKQNSYLRKQKIVEFVNFDDCVKKMEQFGIYNIYEKFSDKYLEKLKQIYELIVKHKLPAQKYSIYLNKSLQFKSLSQDNLMLKNISPGVEQILTLLAIQIDSSIIHQMFSSIFLKNPSQPKFAIQNASNLILQSFQLLKQPQKILVSNIVLDTRLQKLKKLYQLLLTMNDLDEANLTKQAIKKIKTFVEFQQIQPFQLSYPVKNLAKINTLAAKKLLEIFINSFANYFELLLKQSKTLQDFWNDHITIEEQDQSIDFLKKLYNDKILGKSLLKISTRISYLKKFISDSYSIRLKTGVQYPTQEDVKILRILGPNNLSSDKISKLVLPIYPQQVLSKIQETNYCELFGDVFSKYHKLTESNKQLVLDYVKLINDQFKKSTSVSATIAQKYLAFKSLINQRAKLIFDIKDEKKLFSSQPAQEFLYNLFTNPVEFNTAVETYGKRNNCKQTLQQTIKRIEQYGKKKIKKE